MLDFAELFVVVDNWKRLVEIVLNSCLNGLSIVIGSTASLCSLHASLEHDLLRDVVEEDLGCLNYGLLKVNCLFKGSWESIHQIVLKFQI